MGCSDPNVAYCEDVAEINRDYSEAADELVEQLTKLKKNPVLPGLIALSEATVELLRERDEELAQLDTSGVDAQLVNYVKKERELFADGLQLAQDYHEFFKQCMQDGGKGVNAPSRTSSRIGRGRMQIRKMIHAANDLRAQAEQLIKDKSATLGKELPPLYFRLPEVKHLLSPR